MHIKPITVLSIILLSACSFEDDATDHLDEAEGADGEVFEPPDLPSEIQQADEGAELVCTTGICCDIELDPGPTGYKTWGDCVGATAAAECVGHYLDCGSACYNGGDWCAVNPGNTYNTCCSAV